MDAFYKRNEFGANEKEKKTGFPFIFFLYSTPICSNYSCIVYRLLPVLWRYDYFDYVRNEFGNIYAAI